MHPGTLSSLPLASSTAGASSRGREGGRRHGGTVSRLRTVGMGGSHGDVEAEDFARGMRQLVEILQHEVLRRSSSKKGKLMLTPNMVELFKFGNDEDDALKKKCRFATAVLERLHQCLIEIKINEQVDNQDSERLREMQKRVTGSLFERDCVEMACSLSKQKQAHFFVLEELMVNADLWDSVEYLHRIESRPEFSVNILKDAKQLEYTLDNFGYGSTPFYALERVLQHVPQHMEKCRSGSGKYCVFGSSSGWLVFYGAALGFENCVGYEIIPYLVKVSESVKGESFRHKEKCMFYCADMLVADLQEVSIIVLTSQCWDRELREKTFEKLLGELPHGACIIDYNDNFARWLEHSEPHRSKGRYWVSHDCNPIVTPVSWNRQQKMYIFTLF